MVGQRGVSLRPSRQQGTARRIQRLPERTERLFVLISTAVTTPDPFGAVSPTTRARSSDGTVDRDLPLSGCFPSRNDRIRTGDPLLSKQAGPAAALATG